MPSTSNTTKPFPQVMLPAGEPTATARRIRELLGDGPHALVLVFATPSCDRPALAAALQAEFGDVPVLGATTAGEIGAAGMQEDHVAATALPARHFRVACTTIDLSDGVVDRGRAATQQLMREIATGGPRPTHRDSFGMLLIDGLSVAEEMLASAVHSEAGDIAVIGGSAGDGLRFGQTHVFADGRACERSAVLAMIQTDVPFQIFKTQHFVPGDRRMVVTSADCSRRVVHEFDGEQAAPYLARVLGMEATDLGPSVFATHPVVVRIGGADYVRSIQKVEDDGSLTFYCAIEEGLVLRDARGVDLVDNLQATVDELCRRVGEPLLTITFDCILRRLECVREGTLAEVSDLMRSARCAGFSTYGEQYQGMHVNQTLTGVAFGQPGDAG